MYLFKMYVRKRACSIHYLRQYIICIKYRLTGLPASIGLLSNYIEEATVFRQSAGFERKQMKWNEMKLHRFDVLHFTEVVGILFCHNFYQGGSGGCQTRGNVPFTSQNSSRQSTITLKRREWCCNPAVELVWSRQMIISRRSKWKGSFLKNYFHDVECWIHHFQTAS